MTALFICAGIALAFVGGIIVGAAAMAVAFSETWQDET